jgi:hypothetical protein
MDLSKASDWVVNALFLYVMESQDTDDVNPLIRALAIRTMGCLRVEKIIDYLLEPLKKGLKVRGYQESM